MPATVVGVSHKNTGGASASLTTLTYADTGAPSAGDLAFLFLCELNIAPTPTWPSGFTDISNANTLRTSLGLVSAVKRCNGSESGALTCTTPHTIYKTGMLVVVRGIAAIIGNTGTNNTSNTACLQASGRNDLPGTMYLTVAGQSTGVLATFTQPTSYTQTAQDSTATASANSMSMAHFLNQAPTATTPTTAHTSTSSAPYVTQSLMLSISEIAAALMA